jgi:NitT/TauT family transport system permease protein
MLRGLFSGFFSGFFKIRDEPTIAGRLAMGLLCLALIAVLWVAVTRGAAEERFVSPATLGSPEEVFGSFSKFWDPAIDKKLDRDIFLSLWRVIKGFGIAALIAIPLGILCGTFKRINAFFAPISIFGRNIPVVALVPLTFLLAGSDEGRKVLFLFIACVSFVLFDATQIVSRVPDKYLDTAYTLGASRLQIIFKVLIPLALPDLFKSLRLLFGLAFGYIILAEMFDLGGGGLGALIFMSQRRGPREHVYLLLLVITLVAYVIDRFLFWVGRHLFPYRTVD